MSSVVNDILNDKTKFTKEEYELLNTYVIKKEAEFEIKRADLIASTDPSAQTKRFYVDKYYKNGLEHKQLLMDNALEEFQAHKEIVLQCLSILQSLVSNPNVLDTLGNLISSGWYGGQDFKEFLANIINSELNKLNEIHIELWNLRNTPALLYIPELYGKEIDQMNKLPSYDQATSRKIVELKNLLNNSYIQP